MYFMSETISQLLEWAKAVCAGYNIEVPYHHSLAHFTGQ